MTALAASPRPLCPLCGKPGAILHAGMGDASVPGSEPVWSVRRCGAADCGCAWLDPVPLESELHKAYERYYTHPGEAVDDPPPPTRPGPAPRALAWLIGRALAALRLERKREKFWLHDVRERGGSLLEVGCGGGHRLESFRVRGWRVEGQDVDSTAVAGCRARGLVVHEGDLETLGLPAESFDLVLLSHVIEHLLRPVEVLRECRRLLRPGGRIVLSTPNVEALGRRVYGRHWLSFDPPRHILLHGRRSLRRILEEAGFEEISVRTVPVNAEIVSMHSRDIAHHGSYVMNSPSRLGKEPSPLAFQLLALLVHPVWPGSGEECLAVATAGGRPMRSTRPA